MSPRTASNEYSTMNGYHSPSSPQSFSDEHDNYGYDSLSPKQQYAKILYDHTRKQMERFARDARSRGTLSMDHYPYQHSTAAHN